MAHTFSLNSYTHRFDPFRSSQDLFESIATYKGKDEIRIGYHSERPERTKRKLSLLIPRDKNPYLKLYQCLVRDNSMFIQNDVDGNPISEDNVGSQSSCYANQHNEVFCYMIATKVIVDYDLS